MRLIFIENAKPGMCLAKDILADENTGAVYLPKGEILTKDNIGRLIDCDVKQIYIEAPANFRGKGLKPVPRKDLPTILKNTKTVVARKQPTISPKIKNDALNALKYTFVFFSQDVSNQSQAKKILDEIGKVVDIVVETIANDESTLLNIENLKEYDDYTYHHSLGVAVVSVSIGRQLGLDMQSLRRLGLSAILHDMGKTKIPLDIIIKPGKLTAKEFEIIQTHPKEGANHLNFSGIKDAKVIESVLHHHEKYNGEGYPDKLKGENIPLWARIICVADVYDALTSNRPYRDPLPPTVAMDYIMSNAYTFFDFSIVAAFSKIVDLFPIGTCAELSNGKLALIVDNTNKLRPVVEIIKTGEIIDLYNSKGYSKIFIKRNVPDEELANITDISQFEKKKDQNNE